MKKYIQFPSTAMLALVVFFIPDTNAQQSGIRRTNLQQHDLQAEGYETIQARIDFEPGTSFARHSHPGEEVIYVLEGEFEYEVDGMPVRAKAGEVLFIPAGKVHAAKNAGNGKAVELATYIVEKGKPLLQFKDGHSPHKP